MNPMLQNRPDVSQTPKGKTINMLSNLALLLNFVVGALLVHWAVIVVFVIAHVGLRLAYIKLEDQAIANLTTSTDSENTPAPSQPASVRNVATVVTMLVIANLLYWLGFGLRQGINAFM
ncbi:hypothetical protein [Faucicola boevrei]|uniref:hypothetical protein n=1 Tax=Faucicola boevrei TaxID=346665 RepID=UPI0003740FC0|nr:hypothetical protein [Moraxella boevrei]